MKMNPKSIFLLAALSLASSESHAKSSYEKMPVPKKGGTYTDVLSITPITLNPLLANTADDAAMIGYFFMPLFNKDSETYLDLPALAEKVEVSKDKKDYIFTLNKNAKWSDGTPVTVEDVEFTFQKLMDPKVEAAAQRSFMDGVTFQKMDGLKFKFTVSKPKFNSLSVLTSFSPVQKKQFEKESDFNKTRENLHPVGNGPYKLKSISRDQMVVLERDQNWWAKDLPDYRVMSNFDVIQLKIIADPALRYENFLKGNIDTMLFLADQYAKQVKGVDQDKIANKPNSGKPLWADQFLTSGSMPWYGLGINQKHVFLSSQKTRQALAYLVDYQAVIQKAFFNLVTQSISPFGSRTDNVPAELKSGAGKYKYDPKKAAALLKEDGWADTDKDGLLDKTINGKKYSFKVELKTYAGSQPGINTAQILKESWKKAGVELSIRMMDGSALYKDFDDSNFDMIHMGWGGGSIYPDAKQIWHTDSAKGGSNHVNYSNKKVDELIAKSNMEFDQKKRAKLLQEINREIYHDVPYIFTVEKNLILEGINSKLKSPVWIQKYSTSTSKDLFHL